MAVLPTTSVGRKLSLGVGAPVLVATLLGLFLLYQRTNAALRKNTSEEAAALADLLATSFTLDDKPVPAGVLHKGVDAAMRADYKILQHVRDLRVLDRDGTVRWSRRAGEGGTKLADAATLADLPPQGRFDSATGNYLRPLGGMSCAHCHAGDAFHVGAVQASVATPPLLEDVNSIYTSTLLGLVLLFGAVFTATSFSMRRYVTRPLLRLTEAMQKAEQGDFLVRAKIESRDEVGTLAQAFNSMLSRITELKVAEIETGREMELMQRELTLKQELEKKQAIIEETNRTLERRVGELTLSFDVARTLNSTLELEQILKHVTEMVGVRMKVRRFSVMLLDEKTNELVVKAAFGFGDEKLEDNFRLPMDQGVSGLAATSQKTVLIEDIARDSRYVKSRFDPEGDASLLCVPLVFKEKVVGVLNFVRDGRSAFTPQDVMLLETVGSQASTAIVNARLFQETVELSLVDALTGAFNRRHLFSRLEMEVHRAQRFNAKVAVIMIDIDHFKHFNDTCGHPAGDRILKEVAGLLKNTVRKVDTVARYGGEEFTVVLPQIAGQEAYDVADKLRRAVERTKFEQGEKQPGGKVTISVGVGVFPDHGDTVEKVMDSADSALYASKRGGRNLVTLYSPGMENHPGRERGPGKKPLKPVEKPPRTISGELAAIPEPLPEEKKAAK